MKPLQNADGKPDHNDVLDSLTALDRRRVLSILRERSAPETVSDLAALVAATGRDEAAEAVPTEAVASARLELRHVHLPKLSAAGLIAWDESDEAVAPAAAEVLDRSPIRRLLDLDGERFDPLVAHLADGRRRTLLAVLESRTGAVSRGELAHEIASRESGDEPPEGATDAVAADLHHVHLPKLAESDVVDYDAEDGSVTYHPNSRLPTVSELERALTDKGPETAAD